MDLSAVPRMSAQDVVTAGLRAIEFGEVVCAPGVERDDLLQTVFDPDLAAFGAQSPEPASSLSDPHEASSELSRRRISRPEHDRRVC